MPIDVVTLYLAAAVVSAIAALVIVAGVGFEIRRNGLGPFSAALLVLAAGLLLLAADGAQAAGAVQGLGIALVATGGVLLRFAFDRLNGERKLSRAPLLALGGFVLLHWGTIIGGAAAWVQAGVGAFGLAAMFALPLPALLRDPGAREGRAHGVALAALVALVAAAAARGVAVATSGAPANVTAQAPANLAFALALLAGVAACAPAFIVLLRQHEMATLALLDGLTGILNRRALHDRIEQVLALAARRDLVCSVLLADLDHFARINVEHGHRVGDEVLQHFAELARGVVRREDVLGRYGGEQFAMLLFATPGTGALALARRLQTALATRPARARGAGIVMTVSFGVAELKPGDKLDAAEVLRRADAAVEAAKSRGRDCAVNYDDVKSAPSAG